MNRFILFIICLIPFFIFSQNTNEKEDIYFYIESENFFGHNGNYTVFFSLKSQNEFFDNDIFSFSITDYSLDERNIWSLGQEINNELSYAMPNIYFKDKSFCYIHEWLSKASKEKNLFIVTKAPPFVKGGELRGKYLYWEAKYLNTAKDIIPTQLGRGPFYTGR